ncbi:MAG: hypothetical protein WCG12_14780 [Alcaligenaceae bacterium]|jgi:hypothetical protein
MKSSCPHCDAKLEQNALVCSVCHKKTEPAGSSSKNKSLDEVKKNLQNISSKAISMAKVVGTDLANEAKRINEARKQTVESEGFKGAENKKTALKNGAQIFWQKLTGKQKAIVIGAPLLLFIFLMAVFEDKSPAVSVRSNPTTSNPIAKPSGRMPDPLCLVELKKNVDRGYDQCSAKYTQATERCNPMYKGNDDTKSQNCLAQAREELQQCNSKITAMSNTGCN